MTSSHITKLLRAIIILAVAIVMSHAPALAAGPATPLSIPRESLSYKVMFKWGLINKKAGWARLDYSPAGATATAVLYAGSEPWADKLYYLRDTLTTRMSTANHTPAQYLYIYIIIKINNCQQMYSADFIYTLKMLLLCLINNFDNERSND